MDRKNIRKMIMGLAGSAMIALIVMSLFYKGFIRFNYPSTEKYPVTGIDASHHQHDIDWMKVKKQNIQFAFIKATEGGNFKDKKFLENWNNAIASGIDVGAYHFFTFCRSGKEQAVNFIETVPIYYSALPPVIDLEFHGNCTLQIDDASVIAEIDTLQKLLKENYRKTPILYATDEFYHRFLIKQFSENPIWIRNIYREPTLSDERKWLFWQYANRGHMDGIDTYVDLNVFNGSNEEYEKIKKPVTTSYK